MALLKDLIVNGIGRFIGVVHAPKFITDGGTNSLFVKGDGTLDSNSYLTLSIFNTGNPDLAAIEALSGTSGVPKKTAANTWTLETDFVTSDKLDKYEVDYSKEYLTFEALENTTFTFSTNALQYSLDGGTTWATLSADTASPTVTAGNRILWKQTGLIPNSNSGIGSFSSTGNFKAYGNIMSLYYGDNFIGLKDLTGKDYAFYILFLLCSNLVDVKYLILPATTLAALCYTFMFIGCTSLTVAPQLPATTLANACYGGMFYGCSSLIAVPELPATTLATYCYSSMFLNCASLTTAPELPATTLVQSCYQQMFYSCTSLKMAPNLLAPVLVDSCYREMFNGCSSLNYIKCLATDISAAYTNNATLNWVLGVALSGVFIKDSSITIPTGTSGIPNGWDICSEAGYESLHKYQLDRASSLFLDLLDTKVNKVNSSTDNAVVRFDGTSGNIQNSGVTIDDSGNITATSFKKSGGTASQFLKADGSVDSNTYINTGDTALVKSGSLSAQSFIKNGGTASQFLKADGSVDSSTYVTAGSYQMPTNPFGGSGIAIHQNVINNGFYAANQRATVTATGMSGAISNLFDGNYESTLSVSAGNTGVILIDSGSTPLFGSYSYGWTYISFYYRSIPESISMRVYGNSSNGYAWHNLTTKELYYNGGNLSVCYRFNNTSFYSCTKWEITITAPSDHAASVTLIDHLFSRGATQYMSAITKYPVKQDFYGNIEAPAFIKRGGTSLLFLKADGSVDSTAYASLISPSLTGVPSAPTAALGTNTTLIATTAFVKSEIANLASTSPEVLEALEALAEALEASGENPASAIMNAIGNVLSSIPTLVHLTLEEYDALSTALKNNGTWYFIEEE